MKERKVNRRALEIIFDAIKLLGRQGLALRGHDDENSNVYQALQFVKKHNPDIGSWLGRSSRLKLLSHDIQNEILRLYSHDILRRLVSKIQRAKFFSLIADETSDISRKEQVSICVRFVDEQFKIEEAFMGFAETPLANSFICSVGLDISHCRGQSYDGAANMSGHLNRVQKKFHDKHPSMLFVYSSGHQINLAVQDVFRCTDGGMNSLDVLTAVVNFILSSPKRLGSFQSYALGNNCSYVGSLRPLCPTRWVLQYPAIDKFLGNYEIILNWLEEIATSTQSERTQRSSARSYIGSMEKFETYYMLRVLHFVLQQVNNVHTAVQSRDLTVGRCRSLVVEKLIAVLAANNITEAGEMFFEECRSFAGALGLGLPVLPRGRRSSRLTTGNSSELDVKDHYVNMYHVILQETQDALTCRYPAEDLKIATSLKWYLLENNEERIPAIASEIESFYSVDVEA